jgi:putative transcriptional regulator
MDDVEVQMKNRLRVFRAERGWSQAKLAELAQVSRQTINAIETEKYDPSLPLAFKLAELFALSIEEIFLPDEE